MWCSECVKEGLERKTIARGWCHKHYKRWQLYGDPSVTLSGPRVPVEIGERFGRLLVVSEAPRSADERRQFTCRCDCGNVTVVIGAKLRFGSTRSCGCLREERRAAGNVKHGLSSHPLYSTWQGIRLRCNNPNARAYKHYGGRGIGIDPSWNDFAVFLRDVGERPGAGYTLDRIDVNGHYEPGNVRWATGGEQRRNRRPGRLAPRTNVVFDEDLTAIIDGLRGGLGRGDWVRDLVKNAAMYGVPLPR